MMKNADGFEMETCTRCSGTGKFAYNMLDGERCYGCGGNGTRLSARGRTAREAYVRSLSIPANTVAVGMYNTATATDRHSAMAPL